MYNAEHLTSQKANLTAQAVERSRGWRGSSTHKTKARASTGILENVPPCVDVVGECVASNVVIICLCIVNRSDGLTTGRARNRPSSLGDPDRLALACCNGDGVIVPECGVGVCDAVVLCGLFMMCQSTCPLEIRQSTKTHLVVRIGIDTEEVAVSDQSVLA